MLLRRAKSFTRRTKKINLPWGQGVHSAQLPFHLSWGHGLHSTQLLFSLP